MSSEHPMHGWGHSWREVQISRGFSWTSEVPRGKPGSWFGCFSVVLVGWSCATEGLCCANSCQNAGPAWGELWWTLYWSWKAIAEAFQKRWACPNKWALWSLLYTCPPSPWSQRQHLHPWSFLASSGLPQMSEICTFGQGRRWCRCGACTGERGAPLLCWNVARGQAGGGGTRSRVWRSLSTTVLISQVHRW